MKMNSKYRYISHAISLQIHLARLLETNKSQLNTFFIFPFISQEIGKAYSSNVGWLD